MINNYEVIETLKMINQENLDVRTVTMGISLRDCAHSDPKIACQNIYDKLPNMPKNWFPLPKALKRSLEFLL